MLNWKDPYISPMNPRSSDLKKTWRVRYSYFHHGQWHHFSVTNNINRIHDYRDRLNAAKLLQQSIYEKLKYEGWNPITGASNPDTPQDDIETRIMKMRRLTFNEAIQYAFDNKKADWAAKTKQDYGSMLKYFKDAAIAIDISGKKISEFVLPHFKMVMDAVTGLRRLSSHGYNKYRDFLSTLVTELIQWDVVQLNYVHHIKLKKTLKRHLHRPPNQKERVMIMKRIREVHPDYYVFLCVEYGCSLRPYEIQNLQIKSFNRIRQTFTLQPEDAKNKTEREVVIPNWLMGILYDMNLHAYKPTDYIFSAKNKHASFLPGPRKAGRNMSTRTWRKIVKIGMGLNITQYSLKGLGGNDMIKIQRMEGVDKLLELPRQQMGHANTKQTEVYVTEHLDVINDLIRTRMPEL